MGTDLENSRPMYQQIEEYLREVISSGKLKPNDQLPSENTLVTEFGVSRMTVRKALSRLEFEGLVVRQPGRGTFVAKQKIQQVISPIIGFTEKMEQAGRNTATQILDTSVLEAINSVRLSLGLQEHAKVFKIQRLRLVDNEPVVIQTNYVPLCLFPGIQYIDFQQPFTKILSEVYNIEIKGYRSELQPTLPNLDEQRLLQLTKPIPMLLIASISYDQHQRPVRFSKGLYRGDKFKFIAKEFEIITNQ